MPKYLQYIRTNSGDHLCETLIVVNGASDEDYNWIKIWTPNKVVAIQSWLWFWVEIMA